jgi:hypothetical protein
MKQARNSVKPRSTAVAGRPRTRPAAACPSAVSSGWSAGHVPALHSALTVALILALVLLGAASSPANEPVEAQPVPDPGAGVPAATEAPLVDVEQARRAPAATGPAQTPSEPSAEPRPDTGSPAPAGRAEPERAEPTPAPQAPDAVAHNQSRTVQAILQFQRGCQRHCYGTSLTQGAAQRAQTTQDAYAGGDGNGSAAAINQSETGQFVWQVQLGCVAFCFDTTQTQTATQSAETTQSATAVSDALAQAVNSAETMQLVFQHQQSCEEECHGASSSQSAAQDQTTRQTAIGGGEEGFLGWLAAVAGNLGVTFQTVSQYQDSDCLEHCYGGTQSQEARQEAATTQQALAGRKPEVPGPAPVTDPNPVPRGAGQPVVSSAQPADAAPATSGSVERLGGPSSVRRAQVSKKIEFTQDARRRNAGAGQAGSGQFGENGAAAAYTGYVKEKQARDSGSAAGRSSSPSAGSASADLSSVEAFVSRAELGSQSEESPVWWWVAAGLCGVLACSALLGLRRLSPRHGV